MSAAPRPSPSWWSRGLQLLAFLGGIVGMANEAWPGHEPRTILVAAYIAMMGIPTGLTADRRLRSPFGPPESEPDPPDTPSTPHDDTTPATPS